MTGYPTTKWSESTVWAAAMRIGNQSLMDLRWHDWLTGPVVVTIVLICAVLSLPLMLLAWPMCVFLDFTAGRLSATATTVDRLLR